jgi:hypothetical protein
MQNNLLIAIFLQFHMFEAKQVFLNLYLKPTVFQQGLSDYRKFQLLLFIFGIMLM